MTPWPALWVLLAVLLWSAGARAQIQIPPTGNVYDVKIASQAAGGEATELCLIICGDDTQVRANHFDCIPAGPPGSAQVIQTTQPGTSNVCVEGIARTDEYGSDRSAEQATLLARILAPVLGLWNRIRGVG